MDKSNSRIRNYARVDTHSTTFNNILPNKTSKPKTGEW